MNILSKKVFILINFVQFKFAFGCNFNNEACPCGDWFNNVRYYYISCSSKDNQPREINLNQIQVMDNNYDLLKIEIRYKNISELSKILNNKIFH